MKAPPALLAALIATAPAAAARAQSAQGTQSTQPAASPQGTQPARAAASTPVARPANTAPPPPVTVYVPAEQEYSGGPVPPGSHVEHRNNELLMGAGAMVFVAAYVPFAVDGIWQAVRTRPAGENRSARDEVAYWYTVPIVGPYLYAAALNNTEQARFQQLQQQRMNHGTFQCVNTNNVDTQNWCSSAGSGQPQSSANAVTTGEWIWATVLAASQVYGLVMFVAGVVGHSAVVHDPPAADPSRARAAGDHADELAQARARARARRPVWRLDPGAGPTPVGMTLSVITF